MQQEILDKYELVVGLEVHAQLLTQSKAFAPDANQYGQLPNTNISVVTLAHPGILPKFNKKAAEFAIKMGLACHCQITEYNYFDRKNYFYPDLPKGYQITQDKTPICTKGYVWVNTKEGNKRKINLNRIHLEEDAGKSFHWAGENESLIDLNRAGVPLIEIVTEPEIRQPEEAYSFLTEVRKLVRYLEICDGNMEEGSMRCDANISVRRKGETTFGKKVEVKNMNSIRNVQRAIEHELVRQIALIEQGQNIVSETRTFDATTGTTASMRSKEALNDYRYFPDPDLQPFVVSQKYLDEIKAQMPALPQELFDKFTTQYALPEYDAQVLTDTKEIALYFDELCSKTKSYKTASNWVMGPVKSYLNELGFSLNDFKLSTDHIAQLIELVESGKVSFTVAAREIFMALLANPQKNALQIAQELNLIQDSNSENIQVFIDEVIAKYPEKVREYKNGKKGLIGMFMGEVMKAGGGKLDPKVANQLVKESLDKA